MKAKIDQAFDFLAAPRTLTWLGVALLATALLTVASGAAPSTGSAVLFLAVLCSLSALARAVGLLLAGPRGLGGDVLSLVGGAVALIGWLLYTSSGTVGVTTLAVGAATETWQPSSAPGPRHLRRWLQGLTWDAESARGEVLVRTAGVRQAPGFPVVPGRPLEVEGARVVPTAWARTSAPAAVVLTWTDRRADTSGEVQLPVGGKQTVVSGQLAVEVVGYRADFNGHGPSLDVRTMLTSDEGTTTDRRWVPLSDPDHELDTRRGRIAVGVRRVVRAATVRFAVDDRRFAEVLWAGLGLLALGMVVSAGRRRS